VQRKDFNSYGSRRGNHEVMIRGTFANIRIKNQLLDGVEGGFTARLHPDRGAPGSRYDAAENYKAAGFRWSSLPARSTAPGPPVTGRPRALRCWGVKAVIAESYERIHRSNLIGMGVLPLQYPEGQNAESLGLTGTETFAVTGVTELNEGRTPRTVKVTAAPADGGEPVSFDAVLRIDTPGEADYYRNGGILQYVLRQLVG
jgi:aconitate hydratase